MSETEPTTLRVTLRDVYNGVHELQGEVRSMRQEIAVQNTRHESDSLTLADHETRLRRTERWTYGIPASLMAAAASVFVAVVR